MLDLLQKNIIFFKKDYLGETILKQSLIKGTFPKSSFKKSLIENELKNILSPKVLVHNAQEKTDCRFIGELITASSFAETSTMIKQIIMNSEDPNQIKATAVHVGGNVNKDLTIHIHAPNKAPFLFEQDIKAGNNANNPFSGILATVPYTITEEKSFTNYTITINDPVSLSDIQYRRLMYFKQLSSNQHNHLAKECLTNMININNLSLDIIQKNILIQEEIFKFMSCNLMTQRPSFYFAHIIPKAALLHDDFYHKMEPYITTDIFNDKNKFKTYMSKALEIYNVTVNEIAKNTKMNKQLLHDTGFAYIAEDVFN